MISQIRKLFILTLFLTSFFTPSLTLVFAQDGSFGVTTGSNSSGVNTGSNNNNGVITGSNSTPSPTHPAFNLESPFAFKTIPEFLNKILDIIIKIGGILAFFFIIYSGFLFVTAAGSEDQVKKAKAVFLWTVIGVAIVLGARVISELLVGTVNSVVK